jgi:glucose/arabinose dehydrogenase
MTRVRTAATAAAGVLLLAGCGAGAEAGAPSWIPKPSFQGEGHQGPISPAQPQPSGGAGGSGGGGGGSGSPSTSNATDPAVVATKLVTPDAIAVLPDLTALVGERTTGRIVLVQPLPGKKVQTIRTLSGLSSSGGGGLLDLALSPNFGQDNLVFAYVTTASDNRVIAFTVHGPVTSVLTGIPRGPSGNAGRIAFGDDGRLYVATGDAGQPQLAANPASLAGKVLRVTDIGKPAPNNPTAGSAVFTLGHHAPVGLCLISGANAMLEVDGADRNGLGEINLLHSGDDYGWPTASATSTGPISTLPSAKRAPGGCATVEALLFVTSLDGKSLLSAPLTEKGGTISVGKYSATLTGKYGRLATVVAAPDGTLWLTTSNRDGHGKPIADDERVLHINPSGATGTEPF